MAAMLKSAAVTSVNKGPPSSYYNSDKPNPVYQALEQETKKYVAYMKKRQQPDYQPSKNEPFSRAADTLFELWNKYEPRLPTLCYQRKLLEMGDFLVSIKEYNIALYQCYSRYLTHFGDVNVEEISDVDEFKRVFFPEGFSSEDADFTFRALMGKAICTYQVVKQVDPKLQNMELVSRCVQLLVFLRLVTQVILPKESLCWLVYNGTVHIYSIARHLMSLAHSAKVLEYLLWACMCMESSVPLLGVRYLSWRSTLYTAVCQCYYDCRAGHHAEAFARRALTKISELSQLENMSNAKEDPQTVYIFRQATVRMAVMVYKRTVFETRRKPKGLLRPKTRANLRDAQQLPWPRTPSEKLLADMLEGSAAQLLCIMESVTDSNRRTLLNSPPAQDSEVELLDVYAELFMAAQEIIAGRGGNTQQNGPPAAIKPNFPGMGGVVLHKSLIDMATKGEDGVPLSAVVKLVKLAYCFEQWDFFDPMIETTMNFIMELDEPEYASLEKSLEVLVAMERLSLRSRQRRWMQQGEETENEEAGQDGQQQAQPQPAQQVSSKSLSMNDDLIYLAEVLMTVVNGSYDRDQLDMDMMVDAVLFLWNKCKVVFQRYQTGSTDNARYLQRMETPNKWVHILDLVHKVLVWVGISRVDPALTSEVVLRLALVLESSALLEADSKGKRIRLDSSARDMDEDQSVMTPSTRGRPADEGSQISPGREVSYSSMNHASILNQGIREQLIQARNILELGLINVSYARQAVAVTDGKSIADISWVKELNPEQFQPEAVIGGEEQGVDEAEESMSADEGSSDTAVWNTVKDLHLELIYMYHRVCLKLQTLATDQKGSKLPRGKVPLSRNKHADIETFDELSNKCNRNLLSKSLLHMQMALVMGNEGIPSNQQRELLQDAMSQIVKAQNEEKKLYVDNALYPVNVSKNGKIPPPPILLCRTDTSMVFRPASFTHEGDKVSWYRIFGRSAGGSNVKVRLNDYFLDGTGNEIPSFSCELIVSGLTPGEKYVFAVAAYTSQGKLIGDSIGESTKPVLASHPLPVLMTWAYLSQVAYQVGCYSTAHEACEVLWNQFVAEPPPPGGATCITSSEKDFTLTLHRVNEKVVRQTSPVLLRQFLTSIFINVEVSVREAGLYCDKLCDKGPLKKGQIKRLLECERLLVAMEIAGWLNEANQALQAVVQCYGMLAPMIHFKIPSIPIIQILERCIVVLQEIPSNVRQRKQGYINDSLHHMAACFTYHMAKVLRTWGQRALANEMNQIGRKLLQDIDKPDANKEPSEGGSIPAPEAGALTLAALRKKKNKKAAQQIKEEVETTGNEELKALEAHMLRLSKQAQGEHELTGNEDPSILHAYIAYLPSRLAYKEVVKFKRRARYLEFFVQVVQKALTEELAEYATEWCEETMLWLLKRNEQITGTKPANAKQGVTVAAAAEDNKKYAAAVVEYKDKEKETPRKQPAVQTKASQKNKFKKGKYKLLTVHPNMSPAQKQAQEEKEVKSMATLSKLLPEFYRSFVRRRRFRKICADELPWRCQLNILQGLSHFGVFLHKLETHDRMMGNMVNAMYNTTFLDQEWFTFETAGTLIVGWDSTDPPVDGADRGGNIPLLNIPDKMKASGIEMAAAAATGNPPHPVFPVPAEPEEDTPRTYRSDVATSKSDRKGQNKQQQQPQPQTDPTILTAQQSKDMLTKTFAYFTRAVVLAHRGQHWTLLQNACRALWNCAHSALLRTCGQNGETLNTDMLRRIVWKAFYTSADCLLDMLIHLQKDQENHRADGKENQNGILSWMGNIQTEKGGASLKFESPLDDVSSVDARWVRRIILRVLEMLFYKKKWERLADIAIRFNAITDDRYAEQVNPLLIQAQRKLIERITENGGPRIPQPHFQKLLKENGGPLLPKQYVTVQLQLEIHAKDLPKVDPGARIDPEGHDVYGGGARAKQLISVPLDVASCLKTLRGVLDKSQYTARSLQHSRRLLMLYLAGQQHGQGEPYISRGPSHVDFIANTARPPSAVPLDLRKEEFLDIDDIQTATIPRSQISVLISSYDKTIELLLAGNQKGLASEALHELGTLHYHMGNLRGAYRSWTEALDVVFNARDAIHTWRSVFDGHSDVSAALLDRCGLWGCVLGGILTSNMSQYILNSDLGLRTECCFLSGYFFKALFRASLPHPIADRDYALYDVGEGCEVTNLIPGIDLLSERFRCDGRSLVAALRFVTEELARGRHNLFVLPLLTLYQYLTTFVCRDLQRSVDGRILKVRVLTDLGLFNEAFIIIQRLLHGERLPHTADSNFRQVESRVPNIRFNTDKPILELTNLKVMESVVDKRLSSILGALYGPHLTCHLSLVQSHLFIALANTIPVLPEFDDVGESLQRQRTISTMSRGKLTQGLKLPTPSSKSPSAKSAAKIDEVMSGFSTVEETVEDDDNEEEEEEGSESSSTVGAFKRFTSSKKPVTLEMVKGTLLGTADQILTTLTEILQENAEQDSGCDNLCPAELELVVSAKLELATIAQQRHHAAMAARTVHSAMKMLQNAFFFNERKPARNTKKNRGHAFENTIKLTQADNNQYQYQNFQSRSRIDARLWLQARMSLVKSMVAEVTGMGDIKGPEKAVKVELAGVRQYCAEGVAEAEACGDVEMHAEFLLQGALLDGMDGRSVDKTMKILEELIEMLDGQQQLSTPGQLLHAVACIQLTDLQAAAAASNNQHIIKNTQAQYVHAQMMLFKQLENLGEKIEHCYPDVDKPCLSTLVSPIQNLYLPQILHLVQVKLRIAHAATRLTKRFIQQGAVKDSAESWAECLSELTTTLNLCQVSVTRIASLEAEILLNMGKVQRQLVHLGRYHPRAAASTLIQAITTTHGADHDLGLMHQAYLEIALIYLGSAGSVVLRESTVLESVSETLDGEDSVLSRDDVSSRKSKRSVKSKKERTKSRGKDEPLDDTELDRRAGWTAVRCAAAVSQAQRSSVLLVGDKAVTSQTLSDQVLKDLPDFVALDLISSYVLGEKKRVYKNEIEEELASLTESLEPPLVETYDDQVLKAKCAMENTSWVHLIGYQWILRRVSSTIAVPAPESENDEKQKSGQNLNSAGTFDLGVISHNQLEMSPNYNVVRCALSSGTWLLRLRYLHRFLLNNLPPYASHCLAVYPPKTLMLPCPSAPATDCFLLVKEYTDNLMIAPDAQEVPKPPPPPGMDENPQRPPDGSVISPPDNELCFQWYKSSLDVQEINDVLPDKITEKLTMLLFSLSKKSERVSGVTTQAGMIWLPQSGVSDLHDRLSALSQRGEISLIDKPKKEPTPPPPQSSPSKLSKKTSSLRIKALTPPVKRDEELEAFLRQCMTETQLLFGKMPELSEPSPVEAPASSQAADTAEQTDVSSAPEEPKIPFEVNKSNMQNFEKLFDVNFGHTLRGSDMYTWMIKLL